MVVTSQSLSKEPVLYWVLPERKDIGLHSSEHEYSAENTPPERVEIGFSSGSFSVIPVGPGVAHGTCSCLVPVTAPSSGATISIRLNKPNSAKHLMFCVWFSIPHKLFLLKVQKWKLRMFLSVFPMFILLIWSVSIGKEVYQHVFRKVRPNMVLHLAKIFLIKEKYVMAE